MKLKFASISTTIDNYSTPYGTTEVRNLTLWLTVLIALCLISA